MPARDIFYDAVCIALEKDQWTITHDPLFIEVDEIVFFIDVGAERVLLAAQKESQKIAVEIKSFLGNSEITDFYGALGQTLTYRSALRRTQPDRVLYLAASREIYDDFLTHSFIQEVIAEHQIRLLIFDAAREEILLWKE